MKKIENPIEKHLVKVIIFFMIITGALVEVKSYLIVNTDYSTAVFIVLMLFLGFSTYLGRENLFHWVINRVPAMKPKYALSNGTWTIHITFNDHLLEREKVRTGTVHISASLIGVRIVGGSLLNPKNNSVTMNDWFAENAELNTYGNTETLYYIYKIPSNNNMINQQTDIQFEKIGFVHAVKQNNADCFIGFFEDIRVENKSNKSCHRRGKIVLVRDSKSSQ